MPLKAEHVFRLRESVTKTFPMTKLSYEDLCDGPEYSIKISYRPKSIPLDADMKKQ